MGHLKAIGELIDTETDDVAPAHGGPAYRHYEDTDSIEPTAIVDRFDDRAIYETISRNGRPQYFAFEHWWRSGNRDESLMKGLIAGEDVR